MVGRRRREGREPQPRSPPPPHGSSVIRRGWIVTDQPKLRIVSDELWQRVKARQEEQRERSINARRALHKNALTGAGPKYLFSNVLKCGECGANYAIIDSYRYACSNNANRGPAACTNGIKVPRKLVEAELLATLKERLFTQEGVDLFKAEVRRLLAERRSRQGRDAMKAGAELARVEREIANIVTAIKAGIITATTKAELEKAEAEKARLAREIDPPEKIRRAHDRTRSSNAAPSAKIRIAGKKISIYAHVSRALGHGDTGFKSITPRYALSPNSTSRVFDRNSVARISIRYLPLFLSSPSNLKSP